jgi:urease accessory protein
LRGDGRGRSSPFTLRCSHGWRGELHLEYERRGERTLLSRRRHAGPVLVQKALYPEGESVCHGIVLHPPGGYVGGDRIALRVRAGAGAHALLTTPGAGKWYRSAGAEAEQALRFEVGSGAVLEWLPQGTIVFDGALARADTRVDLAPDGSYLGWEIVCLGRTAAGERFDQGRLLMSTELRRGGDPLWLERGRIDGGSRLLASPAGLAGEPVHGTLLAAAPSVDAVPMVACREVRPASGRGAITRLPGLALARYLGPRADDAQEYFARLWQVLRPALTGRAACPPRIWRT